MRQKTKKRMKWGLGLFCVGLLIIFVWQYGPWAAVETEDTTVTLSTFGGKCYVSGEIVSDLQKGDLYVPKDSYDGGFVDIEDIYTLSNFELEESDKYLEDISIDMSSIPYAWLRMKANSVFAEHWYLLVGGTNDYIEKFVGQHPSDLNFQILNESMSAITVGTFQTDGNTTVTLDIPHYNPNDTRVGEKWNITATDFADMSQLQKEYVQDEANYRCLFPTYNPTVDQEKEYDSNLERITFAHCLKYQFNTTLNKTDGSVHQVNMSTVDSNIPVETVISGQFIYQIFYESIKFIDGPYSFRNEWQFANNISLVNVFSGTIVLPRGSDNLGDFVQLSTIGT